MGFSNPGFSQSLQDAIDYAWSKGAVLVAATGNGGSSEPTYPAGDAKVVGVSATDQNDALWSGSNYGTDTFIAAPGVGITADAPGGGTATVTGTSASAALTAGAVALLRANDPAASNGTIVGRLARSADAGRHRRPDRQRPVEPGAGYCRHLGRCSDSDRGAGRRAFRWAVRCVCFQGRTSGSVEPTVQRGPGVHPPLVEREPDRLAGAPDHPAQSRVLGWADAW